MNAPDPIAMHVVQTTRSAGAKFRRPEWMQLYTMWRLSWVWTVLGGH